MIMVLQIMLDKDSIDLTIVQEVNELLAFRMSTFAILI